MIPRFGEGILGFREERRVCCSHCEGRRPDLRWSLRGCNVLVIGFALTCGSLILWPQGLFDLGSEGTAGSLVFIALGAALLAGGVAAIRMATRRLARLKNKSGRGRKGAQRIRERAGVPATDDWE